MTETNYEAKPLEEKDYKSFAAVYNDFRNRAILEYKFELEPLDYEGFIEAYEQELINCIVLLENNIPTAFLVYTTAISEAVELNIIHSLKMENMLLRSKYLIEEFLRRTRSDRREKIVCYPMLGSQKTLIGEIARFGFKFVGIAVLRFLMNGTNSREILQLTELTGLNPCYRVVSWSNEYIESAVEIVNEAFSTSADALFDPRFKTPEGTFDIIDKIVNDVYAQFLPEATSVLMCSGTPVGFCFMNLTGGQIANIPIVAIKKEHQGRGLSKHMLKASVEKLLKMVDDGEKPITEVNTCTETNNFQALKMYRHLGFKEDYNYPQSYLPVQRVLRT